MISSGTIKAGNTIKVKGAVLYTRVSGDEQDKNGTSPETQLADCRKKALELSLPIVAEYYDGGISGGFLLSRKEFQAALADIQTGRADTLICANISRFSRDVEHQQGVKKAVRAAGGHLVFCDMEFADTPEGDLNFAIQGGFAEYERKVIRKRTMGGRRKRAEEGRQPVRTTPPLGYQVVTKADVLRGTYPAGEEGRYVIVEPAASLARRIFEWYGSGQYSLADIAKKFNTEGVPTSRGGANWHPSTLRCILMNSAYKGQAVFGRVEKRMEEGRIGQPHPVTGRPMKQPYQEKPAPAENQVVIPCPPLVSEELWDQAQRRLASNRVVHSGNPRRVRMLAGRVRCPNCGGSMCYQPAKTSSKNKALTIPANYTCLAHSKAKRLRDEAFCNAKTYRVGIVEAAVALAFLSAAQAPQALSDARRLYDERDRRGGGTLGQDQARAEMAAVDRALARIGQEEAAAVQGQIAGIMAGASPGAYAAVFADVAARRKDLEDRRGQLARALDAGRKDVGRAATSSEKGDAALRALEEAALVLSAPDVPGETKRDIVGMVVEHVVCRKDGAEIHFLPGFGPQGEETVQSIKTVSIGDLSSSIVHPREVFKDAVVASAAAIIVAHNHPSGDPTPSSEDVSVTKRLIGAGEIMGIDLLDHIVIGDGVFVSLKERGLI